MKRLLMKLLLLLAEAEAETEVLFAVYHILRKHYRKINSKF